MPNDYNYEQLAADVLGISVEENARRREQRSIDELAIAADRVRRNDAAVRAEERARNAWVQGSTRPSGRRVVQTPRGGSYITDFESSPVLAYAVSVNQSRPIHDDFDSSFAYAMFLNSKYKHHHKCATCLSVFRCGQAKCERTLCKLCDSRSSWSNDTVSATFPTDTVARIDFNGSIGGRWHNDYMVHEASEIAAQNQVTVDYEAVERQLINEEMATGRVDGDIEI